jgi:hypothetical protein
VGSKHSKRGRYAEKKANSGDCHDQQLVNTLLPRDSLAQKSIGQLQVPAAPLMAKVTLATRMMEDLAQAWTTGDDPGHDL